ncbi:hypothetical protein ACTXT7_004209 [Hymenolepis weldensis]
MVTNDLDKLFKNRRMVCSATKADQRDLACWNILESEMCYDSLSYKRGGNTASSSAKTLKDTYANEVVNEKTWRKWFSAGDFKKDDFSLKYKPRAGCSK